MDECIVIENGEKTTVIGDFRFSTSTLAGILMANRMKLRARRIMNEMWPKEQMKNLYIRKTRNRSEEFRIVTDRDMTKIKSKLCITYVKISIWNRRFKRPQNVEIKFMKTRLKTIANQIFNFYVVFEIGCCPYKEQRPIVHDWFIVFTSIVES